MKRLTTEEFIEKAREVHGEKYDYSKVEYQKSQIKICIICPEHGEFWQTPANHLTGKGCFKCRGEKIWDNRGRTDNTIFIEKARKIHGNKYDYSKVEYTNNNTKVCIICPEHGEFWQEPSSHLQGCACPKCKGGVSYSQKDFIEKAKEIHGDKYDYSKVKYKNSKTKVCIICNKKNEFGENHGEFWQTPMTHLRGTGCPKCVNKNINQELFLKRAKKVHGNKYDYSKVVYCNMTTKVCIICPEHGEFWQKPSKHLSGQGCPKCKKSKLEEQIETLLRKYDINFEQQKQFEWLRFNNPMFLDFYLPDYKIAIECQGKQHFLKECTFSKNNKETLELIQKRDEHKRKLCEEHDIKILYFSTLKINFPYNIITNETNLIKEILKSVTLK